MNLRCLIGWHDVQIRIAHIPVDGIVISCGEEFCARCGYSELDPLMEAMKYLAENGNSDAAKVVSICNDLNICGQKAKLLR